MLIDIDLFSDTLTQPTAAMRKAMMAAVVGDEQKGEDPTTRRLEEMLADMLGFSAALFLPSATMANEIAIRLHCERGDELLAGANCHLFLAEGGGPAVHAGAMCKPIHCETGIFTAEDIKRNFRYAVGPHYPVSKLVSVENTTNMDGGVAWSKEQLRAVVQTADELSMKKHMDGARLFNAVIKTGLSAKEIVKGFDTVTVCLSKGLGCPVGAVLLFDKQHFTIVRRLKQLMGGAMRQSGILAAAGIYALENHIERLVQDHQHAELLSQALGELQPNIRVVKTPSPTNMVFFYWESKKITAEKFNEKCLAKGLRFSQVGANKFRAVTHLDISKKDIQKAIQIVKEIC